MNILISAFYNSYRNNTVNCLEVVDSLFCDRRVEVEQCVCVLAAAAVCQVADVEL